MKKIYFYLLNIFKTNKIFKRIFLSSFGNGLNSVQNLTVNILFVKALSVSEFGIFQFILSNLRRFLTVLDFSSIELLLFSKNRNFLKKDLLGTFYSFQLIKFIIASLVILFLHITNFIQLSLLLVLLSLIYVDIRYFILNGIAHYNEVFYGTKDAQIILSLYSSSLLATIFFLTFLVDINLFKGMLSLCVISILFLIIYLFFFKKNKIKPTLNFKVIKSFLYQSIFLQINMIISNILKFFQDLLIIINLGSFNYSFYALSNILSSGIGVISKSIARPLSPFFWRIDINKKIEFIVISTIVILYLIGAFLSIFLTNLIEFLVVQINQEFKGISEILKWSLLFGFATAANQITTSFMYGKKLINFVSIVNSIYSILQFILILILYYFFMSSNFIVHLLILNFTMTTIVTIVLIVSNNRKFYFFDDK